MFLRTRAIKIHRHTAFWKPSIWKTVKENSVEVGVKGRSCDVRRWVGLPLLRDWLWYEQCWTVRFILAQIFAPRCQFNVKRSRRRVVPAVPSLLQVSAAARLLTILHFRILCGCFVSNVNWSHLVYLAASWSDLYTGSFKVFPESIYLWDI